MKTKKNKNENKLFVACELLLAHMPVKYYVVLVAP